jgi:hypothetical protein
MHTHDMFLHWSPDLTGNSLSTRHACNTPAKEKY